MASDCPPGWEKLVGELLDALDDVPGWKRYRMMQIKEKFGGLRAYVAESMLSPDALPRVRQLIRKAEERAEATCQTCGTTNDVQRRSKGGWISTRCDVCWLERHPNG